MSYGEALIMRRPCLWTHFESRREERAALAPFLVRRLSEAIQDTELARQEIEQATFEKRDQERFPSRRSRSVSILL